MLNFVWITLRFTMPYLQESTARGGAFVYNYYVILFGGFGFAAKIFKSFCTVFCHVRNSFKFVIPVIKLFLCFFKSFEGFFNILVGMYSCWYEAVNNMSFRNNRIYNYRS